MYKVTHYEKYVPDDSTTLYDSVDDIKERYDVYSHVIDEEVASLKKGEKANFMYDFYIDLEVERV